MDFEIIFYLANKTFVNERIIVKKLNCLSINCGNVSAATDLNELIIALNHSVKNTKIIFVIGGLSKPLDINTLTVLSKAFNLDLNASKFPPFIEGSIILKSDVPESNGCISEKGNQCIIALPDEPKIIEPMLKNQVAPYLTQKYKIGEYNNAIDNKKDIVSESNQLSNKPNNKAREEHLYANSENNKCDIKNNIEQTTKEPEKKSSCSSKLWVASFAIVLGVVLFLVMITALQIAKYYNIGTFDFTYLISSLISSFYSFFSSLFRFLSGFRFQ